MKAATFTRTANQTTAATELRFPLVGKTDWKNIADKVLEVKKDILSRFEALPDERDLIASNFRMYGSGSVGGAWLMTWGRESSKDSAGCVLLVTLKRGV